LIAFYNLFLFKQVRGQGYDGARNMRGKFNGLKSLILRDNPSAHYIHCYAHQIQLVIVVVAKKNMRVSKLFMAIFPLLSIRFLLRANGKICYEKQKKRAEKEILKGELKTGKGLNQEVSLARAGDTRWGSHHRAIISLLRLFLEVVVTSAPNPNPDARFKPEVVYLLIVIRICFYEM